MKYALLVLALVATPAMAKPVYLTCTGPTGQADMAFDEDAGTLTTGGKPHPAAFTAGQVETSSRYHVAGCCASSLGWDNITDLTINRVTGAWTLTTTIGDSPPIVESGVCKVVEPPKTAF